MVKRTAFTMIELIFAIVLIALVVAAVPQLISRNAQTLQGNLLQEEIFIAARTASELLTQPWDANSPDTSTSRALSKVLDTASSNANLNRINVGGVALPFRIGHIIQPLHRRFFGTVTAPAGFNIPGDDQSPFLPNHTLQIASGYCGESSNDFFAAAPVQSNAAADIRAAKMATITVTHNADANRTVTLRLYIANIGEPDYYHRRL